MVSLERAEPTSRAKRTLLWLFRMDSLRDETERKYIFLMVFIRKVSAEVKTMLFIREECYHINYVHPIRNKDDQNER